MTPRTHLARVPHDIWLVTWCGQEQKRPRRNVAGNAPVVARIDGAEIRSLGAFDCVLCRLAIQDQSRKLLAILGPLPVPEREATLTNGCGDSCCHIGRRSGQATNGGCRCDARELARGATAWRAYALALEARTAKDAPP